MLLGSYIRDGLLRASSLRVELRILRLLLRIKLARIVPLRLPSHVRFVGLGRRATLLLVARRMLHR